MHKRVATAAIVLTLLVFSSGSIAQVGVNLFDLQVTILDDGIDSVRFSYSNAMGEYKREYVQLKQGLFKIADSISQPTKIALKLPPQSAAGVKQRELEFYVVGGMNVARISFSKPTQTQWPDNPVQKDFIEFMARVSVKQSKIDSLQLAIFNMANAAPFRGDSTVASLVSRLDDLIVAAGRNAYVETAVRFIQSHPGSFISLQPFYVLSDQIGIDSLQVLFDGLKEEVRITRSGKLVAEHLASIGSSRIGSSLKGFKFTDLNGLALSLDSIVKTGPVLFDFWASWCGPCIADFPAVKRLLHQYESKGLKVVFVSIDGQKKKEWARAMGTSGIESYLNLLVDGNGVDALTRRLAVGAIPDKILFDTENRIVYRRVGAGTAELFKAIEKLFQ